ncbi:MAG: amidohydrolase [Veillonella seminalis]|nr:amidohydrolase [Veillonella seminalis]
MNGNTDVVADVTTESVAVLNTYADSLAAREARIHEAVKAMEQSLIDLSAYLHDNPEVGLTEHKAVAAITKVLKNKAFTVKTDVSDGTIPELATSLKADKGNMDSFFKMAFLGEYDALPGLGHGCGHNLIAAMSVGAAIGFAAAVPEALTTFFGCPAEETVGGKVFMANAGVFNGYAGALLTHPADVNELGGSSLASHPLEVKFIGRSAHVADLEDHGINALTCAVELYTAVNALKDQWGDEVVIGQIFTEAGEAPNMIPAEAVLHMTVRAHTVEFLEDIVLPAVRSKAEEIAKAQGAKVAMRHYEPLFKDLREDKTWRDLAQAVMTEWRATPTILPDNVAEGSTDMGNVSHVVPTVQLTLAIGEDMGLHTPEFAARAGSPEGLAMIQKGAHIMAITALRYWWRYGRDFDRAVK